MVKIIILYDLIAREYWMCNELVREINGKGGKAYLFSLNYEYYKAIRLAKREKIDLLMIPSSYARNDYERVVGPFKSINEGIIPFCFHHEQIPIIGKEDDIMPSDEMVRNTMYHLSWGENFTKLLIRSGVERDLIVETGNLRLQEMLNQDFIISRNQLSRLFGLDARKKWLIYCDSATQLQYTYKKKNELLDENMFSGKTFNETIDKYAETFIQTNKIFNELSDEIFNRYELIYRPHPGNQTTSQKFFDRRIKIIRDHSIYTWLREVEFTIVFQSSSIFESDCMGVKSVVLMPVPLDLHVTGVNSYYKVSSGVELENILLERNHTQLVSGIYKQYIGDIKPNAISSFSQKVIEIANFPSEKLENIPFDVNKRKLYTSIAGNYLVIILNAMRLLKYVKWPENFNHNKYEHPIFKNKYARV